MKSNSEVDCRTCELFVFGWQTLLAPLHNYESMHAVSSTTVVQIITLQRKTLDGRLDDFYVSLEAKNTSDYELV